MLLETLAALFSVILIDVTLAIDNALVVGAIAGRLPVEVKKKAIIIGTLGAAVFRIAFAYFATKLFSIIGLTFAGGVLLLWLSWKLWREIKLQKAEPEARQLPKLMPSARNAIWQILIADMSMSLDNTLAVAGASRDHFWVLVIGLFASVALMGVAANFLATLSAKYRWIPYVGLLVVLYVSLSMLWQGGHQLIQFGNGLRAN